MIRMTWRGLIARRLRLLATALAIVLGVAFTVGTLVLTSTISRSVETAIVSVSEGVDILVRGQATVSSGSSTSYSTLPVSALADVRSSDGVRAAAPYLEGSALVVTSEGKVVDLPQSVGLNWIHNPDLSAFHLVEGTSPQRGEVVIGRLAADKAELDVGDSVQIVTTGRPEAFRVSGIADVDGGSNVGPVAFVLFDVQDAYGRIAERGTVNAVLATAVQGVPQDDLAERVSSSLTGADVITGSEMAEEQKLAANDAITTLQRVMLAFAGIALFVGAFTIANTFTITLAQRTRELALLRALGGSRRQLMRLVLVESLVLGLLASLVGLLAGLGVARGLLVALEMAGMSVPDGPLVMTGTTVAAALVAGVGVTLLSAYLPARRAARVAPVTAMRDSMIEPEPWSRRRALIGGFLGLTSAALVITGVQQSEAAASGLGGALALATALVLGPVLVRPVVAAFGWPLRLLGVSSRLAVSNATRNARRTAATGAALMIGVALVSGASLFAATAKQSLGGQVGETFTADRVVRPLGSVPGVPAELTASLRSQPGLEVVPMTTEMAEVAGQTEYVTGIDLSTDLVEVDLLDGSLPARDGDILVSRSAATDHAWEVGDSLLVGFASGSERSHRVSGIFEDTSALASVVSSYELVSKAGESQFDDVVLLEGDASALEGADRVVDASPLVTLERVSDFAKHAVGVLDTLLAVVLGFLGLAVLIAVLGIATTIGLSVYERTREIGMLRAVGMARRQVRAAIRWESIVVSGYGAAMGLALGFGITWAVLASAKDTPFGTPAWQAGPLVAVVLGALLAGTLAAAAPARRASRLAILDAVRTD